MFTGSCIHNKYIIDVPIGKGKFGHIFRGRIHKKNTTVAIKMEPQEGELKSIKHEVTILNYLYKRGCRNIPFIYWYGIHESHICMVMNYFPKALSATTMVHLDLNVFMMKCLDIFQNIHAHYVIHRDIKPQNFMFDEHDEPHLIDFGLATIYVDDNHRHLACPEGSQSYILGTPKYISCYVHDGCVPSRRDDLISLGYLYLYLKRGNLPWDVPAIIEGNFPPTAPPFPENTSSLQQASLASVTPNCNTSLSELHVLHPRNQFRKERKTWSNILEYLHFPENTSDNMPVERYLDYCYRLDYSSEPNYVALRQLFAP
jgi:serine/threonine protein kinase